MAPEDARRRRADRGDRARATEGSGGRAAGDGRRSRRLLGLLAAAALAGGAVLLVRPGADDAGAPEPGAAPPRVSSPPPAAEAPPAEASPGPATRPGPGAAGEALPGPTADGPPPDALRSAWARVDLDAVREAMPDNLYWKLAVPTRDARVLQEREEIRERWNDEYGKVLSNTASEDEIHAYFDFRRRLSSDYIEFATHLLDEYGDVLPERDVGLLELAVEMHTARLQEQPRKIAEALERKREQDALREAWLRDEEAFREEAGRPAPEPR